MLIHCMVAHHICDTEDCSMEKLSRKRGTIEVSSINELIHADEDEEFEFTSVEDNCTGYILKEYLLFKMPIFGE